MLMLVADGTCCLKLTLQILFYSSFRVTRSSYNNFNVPFIKNLNRTSAHTTADDDIYTAIGKKVRQESRSMSRVSNGFTLDDLIVFSIKNHETFAMSKVLSHHSVFARYCNFHHFSFPPFFLIFLQPAQANCHRKALSYPCHRQLKFSDQ